MIYVYIVNIIALAHAKHFQIVEALRLIDTPIEHSFKDLITLGLGQTHTELEVSFGQIAGQQFLIHTIVLQFIGSLLYGALLHHIAMPQQILIDHA